jgi:hypothetical protein
MLKTMAKSTYHHLQGPQGLCEALTNIMNRWESGSSSKPLLIFDFDRTLTNGFAEPGQPLDKRIRGGEASLSALNQACAKGIEMFIVTARAPTKLTIEQLEASLNNCQQELFQVFGKSTDEYHVEKVDGRYLAWRGRLFASDYSKPIAVRQILSEIQLSGSDLVDLHFFDDFVMNSFDVGAGEFGPHVSTISTYWWDTFKEEEMGLIGSVVSFSSDFPYQDQCEPALSAFGLTGEQITARKDYYIDRETKLNIKPKEKEELAPPVKIKEGLKANLGGLLAGIKPRMPPPPS